MRRALLVLLVACGGGSEKPPAAPQPPPPDAAVAVAPEEVPIAEEEVPEPEELPPVDIGEERGLLRKPRRDPPPPTPVPAVMGSYPPACVEYMSTFLKLAQCDALGAAKESMAQAYQATVEAWNDMATSPQSPEVTKAWNDGCQQGREALVQTAVSLGCPL